MSSGNQVELAAAGFIVVAIIIPIVFGVAFGIAVPLIGAMVRYRAHYRPQSVSLGPDGKHDEDEDMLDSSLPQATSLLGTLRRVKALEGWYGLYKGMCGPWKS